MTDCPRSNRSGWMSFRNWGLMWRCVMWWPLEPEELVLNEKTQKNWLIRLLLIYLCGQNGNISWKMTLVLFLNVMARSAPCDMWYHHQVNKNLQRKRYIIRWRSSLRIFRIRNSSLTDNQSWCLNNRGKLFSLVTLYSQDVGLPSNENSHLVGC